MSDVSAVVLALCTAGGALVARPVPLWLGLVIAAVALAGRWAALLWVGAALVASALAARSWAGLEPPRPQTWRGTATLVADPVEVSGSVRVEARIGRRRVEAWARGPAANRLRPRLAGERVAVAGRLGPIAGAHRARLARRHLSGHLGVSEVGAWRAGEAYSRLANGVRRTLARGASSMSPSYQALFAGFVLGDDRGQPPEVVDDFRASGLTHLLVVSGANVAFVLALCGPVLRRLSLAARLVVGLAVLAFFGVLTRWEPSVMRAEAMAALVLVAAAVGRPASRVRVLALGVAAVLFVDPLLAGSVGFLLSVGACFGIVVLAAPLASALPGPRPIAEALGVTAAAQVGVAPVLVPVFGGVPVASLPANLLAVPAAGPLLVWGLVGGLPAGLLGGPAATVLHLPTRALVGWVASVARWGAGAPLGELHLTHVVALVVAAGTFAVARRRGHARVGVAAAVTALFIAAAPAVALARAPDVFDRRVARGAQLWRVAGATVLVLDDARAEGVLEGARRSGIRRVDVIVVSRRGSTAAATVAPVRRRLHPRLVLAPEVTRIPDVVVPGVGDSLAVGALEVRVGAVAPRLEVSVHARSP